jgi:hypothetical protein
MQLLLQMLAAWHDILQAEVGQPSATCQGVGIGVHQQGLHPRSTQLQHNQLRFDGLDNGMATDTRHRHCSHEGGSDTQTGAVRSVKLHHAR